MKSASTTSKTLSAGILFFGLTAVSSTALGDSGAFFSTDFDSGAPSEFSGVTTITGVQGYAGFGTGDDVFGGQFLRNDSGGVPMGTPGSPTRLTLTGLPPHSSIDLHFLLAIIDSWDGDTGGADPDVFNVTIDGDLVFSESFTNISIEHTASYPNPETPAGVVLVQEEQLGFGMAWFQVESGYDMGLEPAFLEVPHTSSTLIVEWFANGAGWQGGGDESWAIENVEVYLSGPTPIEGTTWGQVRSLFR